MYIYVYTIRTVTVRNATKALKEEQKLNYCVSMAEVAKPET